MCKANGCRNPVKHIGLCGMHYMRQYRHGDYRAGGRFKQGKYCLVEGCDTKPHTKGLCDRHKSIHLNGLTIEGYESMWNSQYGSCLICEMQFTKTPHIDHDHSCCNKRFSCGDCVRGLLCSQCNMMLGLAKDNKETLLSAIRYLDEHKRIPQSDIHKRTG